MISDKQGNNYLQRKKLFQCENLEWTTSSISIQLICVPDWKDRGGYIFLDWDQSLLLMWESGS